MTAPYQFYEQCSAENKFERIYFPKGLTNYILDLNLCNGLGINRHFLMEDGFKMADIVGQKFVSEAGGHQQPGCKLLGD